MLIRLDGLARSSFPFAALAFAAGVWRLQQCAVLPAPTFLALAALLGSALWWWAAWRAGTLATRRQDGLRLGLGARSGHRLGTVLAAGLLGFAWAGAFAQWRLADALAPEWEGRDIEIVGVVAGLPQAFERGLRFSFDVEQSNAQVDGPVPSRISLSWYRTAADLAAENPGLAPVGGKAAEEGNAAATVSPMAAMAPMANTDAPPTALPRVGERWRLVVRLKRPHGQMNPHGFDYEAWLFERKLRATGYVKKSALAGRLGEDGQFSSRLDRLRETLRLRMQAALGDAPHAGVLIALAIGDQQAIAPAGWRLFAATGITHLMSISGLHVTLLGALIAWMVNRAWRRSRRLPLCWPAQKAAALAGLLGALAYAALAGFGVPAQRTLYMLAVVVLALVSGRALSVWQILGAALVVVLLIDPWAVLAAGFWLSFAAVALLFHHGNAGERHWVQAWLRSQWALTLGLLPILLALFQQFSLVSPLANLVAIPLVSMVVTPLALLGQLPGCSWALTLAHALLTPLMALLEWLAALPGALWQQHAPPGWSVVLALFGVFWLLRPLQDEAGRRRWRIGVGLLALLPLFLLPPSRPVPGAVVLTLLDVGQGQAVHVQTATHDLLYDAGPDYGETDAGTRVILPYLRAAGVARLDALVLSHADSDHAGGADAVLAGSAVGMVMASFAVDHIPARRCQDGDAWEWDGVRFRFLHPAGKDYAAQRSSNASNAMSCVLLIESPHGRILLPGDLDGAAEAELLARHAPAGGNDLRSEVLVAAHHGAKKTASPALINAVAPRWVLFSLGYRNRYGHPHAEVLARFAASGAALYRTDQSGALRLALPPEPSVAAGQGMPTAVQQERLARQRYWHLSNNAKNANNVGNS